MLRVVVYVNRTPIAEARAGNMSGLSDISDYKVRVFEDEAPHLDIPAKDVTGWIKGHTRRSSVWYLVRKIAELAVREIEATSDNEQDGSPDDTQQNEQ